MKPTSSIFTSTSKRVRYRVISGVLIAGTIGLMINFNSKNASTPGGDKAKPNEAELETPVAEPVDRDFAGIKDEGVLRMITRFNSSSYFLHRGEEKGFEYEFARKFADLYNLELEVVIAGNDEDPLDLLKNGKGDFIATNFSITPERLDLIAFSEPYNLVDQVLVFSEAGTVPETLDELNGLKISIRKGSSYYNTLRELKETHGYRFEIDVLPPIWDTEAILFGLVEGEFDATVADENLYIAASHYIDGLVSGPVVSSAQPIAWGIRANAPELKELMNDYVTTHFHVSEVDSLPRRSAYMNVLRQRYFDNRPASYAMRSHNTGQVTGYEGYLSPYDQLVKPIAEEYGVDWKLAVAVMVQESRFDPYAQSRMGAIGLMQIIPRFSLYEEHELWDPEINVREGMRYLRKHLAHYSYMDEDSRLAFALATYNAGMGHMADARRLTVDRNRDPNNWDHVAESLLLLMQPRFFQNARFGFVRGTEPVNYVKEIKRRYQVYQNMAHFASEDPIFQRNETQNLIP